MSWIREKNIYSSEVELFEMGYKYKCMAKKHYKLSFTVEVGHTKTRKSRCTTFTGYGFVRLQYFLLINCVLRSLLVR